MLVSKLLLWRKDQKQFIESLPGSALEHIRRAIDDYIEKLRSRADATTSPSKSREGGQNGRSGNTYSQPSATQG